MRILALEPYYGGSHKAFLDGWSERSRHEWTVLHLPPRKWKWRMRHAAVTLADMAAEKRRAGSRWDLIFCSDMLSLADFLGLARRTVGELPSVAYFHENQLTYPVRHEDERDFHYGLSNMMTALAADGVWFNTDFHRDSFLEALGHLLKRMPDYRGLENVERIRRKSCIQPQGIEPFPPRGPRHPGPARILWAARWEHDKNPQTFFQAVEALSQRGVDFRLSVIGEQFRDSPPVFETARKQFAARIDRWGFQPGREAYRAALTEADVIVSTARHEFFGVGVCEAIAAGAYPLLPRRLAYPEILSGREIGDPGEFFYDGSAEELTERLADLARRLEAGDLWQGDPARAARAVARFAWPTLAPQLDDALQKIPKTQG